MANWQQDDIPRTRCFSLGDFHDFDYCPFRFFVNHHLEKKYELAEGSEALVLGSLLDLAIKKFHATRAYGMPAEQILVLIKAAQTHIKDQAVKDGPKSFYGPLMPFLTSEVINKAQGVFKQYYQGVGGKFKIAIHKNKLKPFWKAVIQSPEPLVIWGGPDGIELGDDGIPEVVDYKLLQNRADAAEKLDMDLMPKVYTFLCAQELKELGYSKTRFKVRLWNDPKNESFYEEFDLLDMPNIEAFLKDKMERILRTSELGFCEKDWCKVCKSDKRKEWVKELQKQGWINTNNL